jgi:hypothetical protein
MEFAVQAHMRIRIAVRTRITLAWSSLDMDIFAATETVHVLHLTFRPVSTGVAS